MLPPNEKFVSLIARGRAGEEEREGVVREEEVAGEEEEKVRLSTSSWGRTVIFLLLISIYDFWVKFSQKDSF